MSATTSTPSAPRSVFDGWLDLPFARVERERADLRPYQREAVDWLRANPFSGLFIDMGLGKTAICLTLLSDLADNFGFRRALIVAPLKVANETWPDEIGLWRHTACLPYRLLTGERAAREAAMRDPASLHIVNREAVPWLVEAWGRDWPYDVLVFDESTRLGDHASVVFRAVKAVRPALRRFHQLTATPAPQTVHKLFAPTWLLDKGERLGTHVTHFRRRWFTENAYTRRWEPREGALEEITARIADICLVMRRKDHLAHMPDPVVAKWPVRLGPAEAAMYAELEREFVLELDEAQLIEAATSAALRQKLLQLASGAVYDAKRRAHPIHERKVEALRELREQVLGSPLLVAYWFKSSRERLLRAFPDAVALDRAGSQVKAWNERRIPMLLVHPQSAAHGLNMQFGGHHLAVFDIFDSLELFLQLVKRLDRPGQTETVVVRLLAAAGTIDDDVVRKLERLEGAHEALLERLQALHRAARAAKAAAAAA